MCSGGPSGLPTGVWGVQIRRNSTEIRARCRYGYRGLIVSFDQRCTAGERWYLANQTQPDRNQAWYHVLVHDSVSTTYAAESNLLPDPSNEEVNHPLVDQFFVRSPAGHYQRNDRPWTV